MDLHSALVEVALPALADVVEPGELESLQVSIVDDPSPGSVAISVGLVGEHFDDLLVDARILPEPPAAELRDRFQSNLVDFIAESRFAWGQNRG